MMNIHGDGEIIDARENLSNCCLSNLLFHQFAFYVIVFICTNKH